VHSDFQTLGPDVSIGGNHATAQYGVAAIRPGALSKSHHLVRRLRKHPVTPTKEKSHVAP
jgi:hypothetical protein